MSNKIPKVDYTPFELGTFVKISFPDDGQLFLVTEKEVHESMEPRFNWDLEYEVRWWQSKILIKLEAIPEDHPDHPYAWELIHPSYRIYIDGQVFSVMSIRMDYGHACDLELIPIVVPK